ncbi:type III secretion system translocon subunit SctE [Acinetobacter baumannii]|uniref:type III secretion system translocon subunit SctE n=1 Tax=Acinetobacter baumannii TaxID=470 RepID=UPI0034CD2259
MNGKINNDITYERKISTFSPSKEVEKVNKESVKQAQIINTVTNEKVINEVILKDKNNFEYPVLRAPIEQEKNSKKINTKSDLNFNIKTAEQQEAKAQLYPQKTETEREDVLNSPIEANRKEEVLANQKHLYDDNKRSTNQNARSTSPTETENALLSADSNKSKRSPSKGTNDFLYLQLSYQNLINQSILDKLKDINNLDYYLDKLDKLSQGVDGLKDDFQSILDDMNKYKDAYTDYWMEIYNQIKGHKFKTKEEVIAFLKNKDIPDSVIKKLLSTKINSREEMAAFLKDNFPFINLPDSTKDYTLADIDKLYNKLAQFLNEAFKYMPNVSMSNDKLNSITSHKNELNSLINKKNDDSIKNRLDSVKDIYQKLTETQSKIELEVASHSLSGMALLTFLLAKLRELTLKVTLERAEGEQKLFDEMQEVTTKTLKEKIEDQKAQIKKQEEIQYWAGIGLKILGGLLTLIAGIASIFTAGASLALVGVAVVMMAASVTLTVADEIYQAVNNKSFMEEAMAPVTEAIGEVVDKIVDAIVDMLNSNLDALVALGLDKNTIQKAKEAMQEKLKMAVKIIVTIGLLVGGVALSFVAGSAANMVTNVAKKIFTEQVKMTLKKMMHDYLEAMLGKMVKEIIMETLENILKSINKVLSKDLTAHGLKTLNRTVVMSRLGTASASSAVNIYTATITDKIIRSVADTKKLQAILDMIQKLIEKIMDSYHDQVETLTEILRNMSDNLSVSNKTRANIVKNITI